MHNIRSMLPFFVLGAFAFRRWEIWKSWRIGFPCFIAYLSCVFWQGDIWQNGLSFYGKQTTWVAFLSDSMSFLLYLARLANGVVGSIGVMWLLRVVLNRFPVGGSILAPLGMTTLWVYILHQWILARIIEVGWFDASLPCALLWMVILFVVCHVVGLMVRRAVNMCALYLVWDK